MVIISVLDNALLRSFTSKTVGPSKFGRSSKTTERFLSSLESVRGFPRSAHYQRFRGAIHLLLQFAVASHSYTILGQKERTVAGSSG
jgi:hypothetical protein